MAREIKENDYLGYLGNPEKLKKEQGYFEKKLIFRIMNLLRR